ncbi:MAG: flagellar biosynthesis repressor FlbT [Hyphomicrobiaceae bacterium]|nr:flagellar biosynthesis repressor FlbT [Hyphomicrobiaceae bacterium]
MSLKVELKPGERLIIGNSLITNSDQRTRLFIDGDAPVLREKDILTPATADTPAKRVYLAIQLMYTSASDHPDSAVFDELLGDFARAVPSSREIVDEINNWILTKNFYKALKSAQKLIAYEREILDHAQSGSTGVPAGRQADGESTGS